MLLALCLLAAPLHAAEPLTTSWWYESFTDDHWHTVYFQVHYPAQSSGWGADADPSHGPYPLLVFMHGWLGQAWMYQQAADALAAQGFVVVNIDTETGLWTDTDQLALDADAALSWVADRSLEPDHWLSGMASDDPWTAMGHSMGGVALGRLVGLEPRVRVAVGFSPYQAEGDEYDSYADYTGAALFIGGSADTTATPDMVSDWFESLGPQAQGMLAIVEGAGHQAITDLDDGEGSLSDEAQRAADVALAIDFLNAEFRGEEDAWDGLICDRPARLSLARAGLARPVTTASRTADGRLRLGLAASEGDTAVIYVGEGEGETVTPDGTVGLSGAVALARVSLEEGLYCGLQDAPEAGALQVAFVGGEEVRLGRIIPLGALPEGDGGEDGSGEDSDGSRPDGAAGSGSGSGGCATGGPRGPGWLGLGLSLVALGVGRRR